jgi:hypothetical protein
MPWPHATCRQDRVFAVSFHMLLAGEPTPLSSPRRRHNGHGGLATGSDVPPAETVPCGVVAGISKR